VHTLPLEQSVAHALAGPLTSRRRPRSLVWGVALSADGRLLASASEEGTVRLWEVPGGRLRAALEGHAGLTWGMALSGDGRLVATADRDGTVSLWEVPGGTARRTLRHDRAYERLDLTGRTGVTAAQRAALLALGAIEHET
jgi:WD40 repeat protein